MKIGKCYLCKSDKPLLTKAHVIPDWMYFGMFDENHKLALVDLDQKAYPKRPSTGAYDADVYCESCDNEILGSLESYGKYVLCEGDSFVNFFKSSRITITGGLKSAQITVDDYSKFKLFLLSLIWKMHVSKQPFFRSVDLGATHFEYLRSKILSNEKVNDNEYEVAILGVDNLPELIINAMSAPRRIRKNGNTYYVLLINGLFFMFNISQKDKMGLITKSKLRENGEMAIPLLEGDLSLVFYDSLTGGVKLRRGEK